MINKTIIPIRLTLLFLVYTFSLFADPASKDVLTLKRSEFTQAVTNDDSDKLKQLTTFFLEEFHTFHMQNILSSQHAAQSIIQLQSLCMIKELRPIIVKALADILIADRTLQKAEKLKKVHEILKSSQDSLMKVVLQSEKLTKPDPLPEELQTNLKISTLIDQSIGSANKFLSFQDLPAINGSQTSSSSESSGFFRSVSEQVAVWVGAALALGALKIVWDKYLVPPDPKLMLDPFAAPVTFKDIAGIDEILTELQEVIQILKHPEEYVRFGIKPPRGILLEGPPGVGKTLIARAIANEAGCKFIAVSGAEFIEMYVGVGAARLREVFKLARENQPCIIFIDEFDAIGESRFGDSQSGDREYKQTLNQLLVEMDGFNNEQKVVVLAATNRAEILDPAVKRPGRLTKIIQIKLPNEKARKEILQLHFGKLPLVDLEHIDIPLIASKTNGFNSAELADLVNIAALNAMRRQADQVENIDAMAALTKAIVAHNARVKLRELVRQVQYERALSKFATKFSPEIEDFRATISTS